MIKYFENWCNDSHGDVFDYSASVEHDTEHLPNKRLTIPEDPSFLNEKQFAQLEKVRCLKLERNQLSAVPFWLATAFKNVTVLSLHANRLTAVPTFLSALRVLNELDLSFNGIQEVPAGIFEPCTNFHYLKLTSNAISTFPIIHSLRELHIGYNEIEVVPESIIEMTSLTVLNVEGNRLSFLPASLANLKNLRSVLIAGNNISDAASLPNFNYQDSPAAILKHIRDIKKVPIINMSPSENIMRQKSKGNSINMKSMRSSKVYDNQLPHTESNPKIRFPADSSSGTTEQTDYTKTQSHEHDRGDSSDRRHNAGQLFHKNSHRDNTTVSTPHRDDATSDSGEHVSSANRFNNNKPGSANASPKVSSRHASSRQLSHQNSVRLLEGHSQPGVASINVNELNIVTDRSSKSARDRTSTTSSHSDDSTHSSDESSSSFSAVSVPNSPTASHASVSTSPSSTRAKPLPSPKLRPDLQPQSARNETHRSTVDSPSSTDSKQESSLSSRENNDSTSATMSETTTTNDSSLSSKTQNRSEDIEAEKMVIDDPDDDRYGQANGGDRKKSKKPLRTDKHYAEHKVEKESMDKLLGFDDKFATNLHLGLGDLRIKEIILGETLEVLDERKIQSENFFATVAGRINEFEESLIQLVRARAEQLRKDSIRLQDREAAKMEYKNDIKEKLLAVGQLYLAINKITEQYAAIMNDSLPSPTSNNTNDSAIEMLDSNGKQSNDQLQMLQAAISDLDFKISTLLKQPIPNELKIEDIGTLLDTTAILRDLNKVKLTPEGIKAKINLGVNKNALEIDSKKWIVRDINCKYQPMCIPHGDWQVFSAPPINFFDIYSAQNLALKNLYLYNDYSKNFLNKPHKNYVGLIKKKFGTGGVITQPLILSINQEKEANGYRFLIRTVKADLTCFVNKKPNSARRKTKALQSFDEFQGWKLNVTRITKEGHKESFLAVEEKLKHTGVKVGLIYCAEGQTQEPEMLTNTQASPAFQQFLEFIGDKVRLKGYTKFNGGLDVETDNTGTHSIATEYEGIQLMFHVSTMLPHNHSEYEQLVKRQFIGNDVVCIIFMESEQTLSIPQSKFSHVYFFVQPVKLEDDHRDFYRLSIAVRKGVQSIDPILPPGEIYEKTALFKSLLLTQIVNYDNIAINTAARLSEIKENSRRAMLARMYKEWKIEKK